MLKLASQGQAQPGTRGDTKRTRREQKNARPGFRERERRRNERRKTAQLLVAKQMLPVKVVLAFCSLLLGRGTSLLTRIPRAFQHFALSRTRTPSRAAMPRFPVSPTPLSGEPRESNKRLVSFFLWCSAMTAVSCPRLSLLLYHCGRIRAQHYCSRASCRLSSIVSICSL